jgi:hypothetical protein
MGEKPQLESLRETSVYPSKRERTWDSFVLTLRGRTATTVILALTIIIAMFVGLRVLI